jgi:hypothetical protein
MRRPNFDVLKEYDFIIDSFRVENRRSETLTKLDEVTDEYDISRFIENRFSRV